MNRLIKHLAMGLFIAASLSACESAPESPTVNNAPKTEIQFVDLQGFDADLYLAMSTQLPKVDVNFYDRVSPSAVPSRLQNWLSSVEAGGGKVKITPPKSDISAKDPFLLLSMLSSIWSASKVAKEASSHSQFAPARGYDAELVLKEDSNGHSVIDHVVFVKRSK
jgi:hypothetical protein